MPLHVIGAGFGRTGTNSLKLALEMLGLGPCHHMKEVVPRKQQIMWFSQAAKGEHPDWSQVYANFNAAVDWPTCTYYRELAEHFPDAKIILSVRDPQRWYDSVSETIYPVSMNVPVWIRLISQRIRQHREMVINTIWCGTFHGRFEEREYAISLYEAHIENVKAAFPPERLLVHEASQGWQPLCEFLGTAVPEQAYPRVNEAKVFKRVVASYKWLRFAPWLAVLIALALTFA